MAERGTRTVLIVDDDEAMRSLLDAILGDAGFQTITASNGKEALQKLSVVIPDLIISDCVMPVMGGDELFRAVKEDPRTHYIPYVVLSGANDVKFKEGRFAGYIDAFLIKPFDNREVISVAERFLRPLRLLVVEDDTDVREMLSLTLARQSFDVLTAAGPGEALQRLEEVSVDAVFSDVNLGTQSGYDLARTLRGLTPPPDPRFERACRAARDVPLVMTSALDTVEMVPEDLRAEIDGFLPKPYNTGELATLMRLLVGRRGA